MSNGTDEGSIQAKPCSQTGCGHNNPLEAQFCTRCGKSLAGVKPVSVPSVEGAAVAGGSRKVCPDAQCGHENAADARYCARCGEPLGAAGATGEDKPKNPFREIVQPFIDLVHAPRALWGINLAYVLEGMVYFGMLGYLAIHFSDFIFQGVEHADEYSHNNVMVLTAGITIAMFFLGSVADKWGVRFALVAAFVMMFVGRSFIAGAPNVLGLEPARPGVFVGDNVDLHVTKIGMRDGIKTIMKAAVISNDKGGANVGESLAIDLAANGGVAPSDALESKLVKLSEATVVSGEENTWTVEYGDPPVSVNLLTPAAEELGFCEGAVISLDSAYVTSREREGDSGSEDEEGDEREYIIRTHWAGDFARIDRSQCTQEADEGDREISRHEEAQKAKERWGVSGETEASQGATPVDVAGLRALEDGPVNVVLRDAYVTYVRNGGYFLQAERGSPGVYAFVSPLWSPLHLLTLLGMVLVVIGYGMYQPAAYAGVRQFTTPKTAAMGFAMLYALMNLGGWLPSFAFMLRDEKWLGLGIPGTYWVYVGVTLLALFFTIVILSRKTIAAAVERAKRETAEIEAPEGKTEEKKEPEKDKPPEIEELQKATNDEARVPPLHMWLLAAAFLGSVLWKIDAPWNYYVCAVLGFLWVAASLIPLSGRWLARHPLADLKFFFFIFALIPVQTLFTYNWLILPQYISRAFEGWIGDYFEIAANANPLLIFVAVPLIAAATLKAKVYNMMIYGTFIMAAPAFLLAIGPSAWTLGGYLLIMTIGEAMWQPRFLQYAAEIAPEGRTGQYMGVAQLPWFLTKMLVPWLYSGWMMDRYCPAEGTRDTETMWFVFACIAMVSTILLMLAKGWLGKDFKTKAN